MNRKKSKIILILLISCLPTLTFGQTIYGSNNGKYLTIRGTKVYYEEYGKGTPLILLHAGMGSISNFQKNIPKLSERFRVIAIDAPGLGRSEYADSALSYPLLADYYSKAMDLLQIDSVYVLGWSDGAITGFILASNRPDKIKKLVAAGGSYKLDGATKEAMTSWHQFTDTAWMEKNMQDWIRDYKRKSPTGNWRRYIIEAKQFWFNDVYFPKSVLEAINIPTLIIYGDRDVYTPEHGLEIHYAIKQSQFCIVPNCSHDVFGEKPDLVNQIVISFLNEK